MIGSLARRYAPPSRADHRPTANLSYFANYFNLLLQFTKRFCQQSLDRYVDTDLRKKELICRREYAIIKEVKKDLIDYIESFYNKKRSRSYLGYMSPVEFKLNNCA